MDLDSCEDWELEVRPYQECGVVALPELWSHVRWIDDGMRIGRACPRAAQESRAGIWVAARSTDRRREIHSSGPTHGGFGECVADFRCRISSELARLEAARA